MTRFLIRRLALTIPVLVGVATLVFSLIHLVPGDPVQALLGERRTAGRRRMQLYRLDRPLTEQCVAFARGVMRRSRHHCAPITGNARACGSAIPATLELTLAAMLVSFLVAVPLGLTAAARARTAVDHGSTVLALFGMSLPTFWLGPLLALIFSVWLGWLPCVGSRRSHIVLPSRHGVPSLASLLADDALDGCRRTTRTVCHGGACAWGIDAARPAGTPFETVSFPFDAVIACSSGRCSPAR